MNIWAHSGPRFFASLRMTIIVTQNDDQPRFIIPL